MGLRSNPTYRQRRFGTEVRRIRERIGLSSGEAAEVMGIRQSQLSNIEAGKTGLPAERLRALARTDGATTDTYIDGLIELGSESGKGWWSDYRNALGTPHLDLAELEAGARRISSYEPMFVPGLLQTEEYAAAVHRDGYADATPQARRTAVEFRMQRQKALTGEPPPRFHAIIHEAALHASLGDRAVMRGQLLRLIEVSRFPNVTVQILPFDGRIGIGAGFVVLKPKTAELATVVVDHVESSLYLDEDSQIAKYSGWFAKLGEAALPPIDALIPPERHAAKDSLGLIQRLLYPLF
jgi:transcriptional regulator with XRE-family HTH domain